MSRVLSTQLASAVPIGGIIDAAGLSDVATVDGNAFIRVNSTAFYSWQLVPSAAKNVLMNNLRLNSVDDPDVSSALGTALSNLNLVAPPSLLTGVRSFSYGVGTGGALTVNASGYTVSLFGVTGVSIGFSLSSNGTTQVAYYANSDSTVAAVTSTNGITWTPAAVTGTPTFSGLSNKYFGALASASNMRGAGNTFATAGGTLQMGFWFGARFVLVASQLGSTYAASISTDGTTFGGDATTAVLGASNIANSGSGYWYRNGNAGFFVLGTAARFTTDGGATWAAVTNPPAATDYYRTNTTAPAKLTALLDGAAGLRVSTDSGATWTSRALPFASNVTSTSVGTSLAYFGAVGVLVANQTAYVSTNDFATINTLSPPTGVTGIPIAVFADASRIYIYYSSNQIAITTNGTTFTVRNIVNSGLGTTSIVGGIQTVAIDTSNVLLGFSGGFTLSTVDGGVTWRWANSVFDTAVIAARVPAPESGGLMITATTGGNTSVAPSANLAVPGGYRATTTAISPIRTGAIPYARVA